MAILSDVPSNFVQYVVYPIPSCVKWCLLFIVLYVILPYGTCYNTWYEAGKPRSRILRAHLPNLATGGLITSPSSYLVCLCVRSSDNYSEQRQQPTTFLTIASIQCTWFILLKSRYSPVRAGLFVFEILKAQKRSYEGKGRPRHACHGDNSASGRPDCSQATPLSSPCPSSHMHRYSVSGAPCCSYPVHSPS